MKIVRWGWYSVGINLVLAGINLAVATISGSLAVGAELVHNLADLVSAAGVLAGITLADRKTKRFPYGLYKLENIVAVAVALLIFFTAYEFVRRAVFAADYVVEASPWMLGGLAAALVIAFSFARLELRVARKAGSPALGADAKEYHVHVLTTGIAFAAIAAEWLDFPIDQLSPQICTEVLLTLSELKT